MSDNINFCSHCCNCIWLPAKFSEEPCCDCMYGDGMGNEEKFVNVATAREIIREATEPTIKGSGERREFETGAVRDCAEGKGRCDLLPIGVVAAWMSDIVLDKIAMFVRTHDVTHLRLALDYIAEKHFSCKADLVLEMAIHMEEGLKKYPERNWENGISVHSYIDSGVRHYLKVLRGDDDENHLRSCVWNLMCCIWTMDHKPEMDDLPKREEANAE